ncbi:hypothetical protein RRG08_038944 [Elysia crispata]|uniref:Fibrinogen C-terminal domain-containing protein n=1 Tax=Elysia crispata TaxID=231223 RepID=A0AAE0Y7A0_9GAST|nr:hypothetical protein RRG08_038944 [Elysia crispata]
MERTLSIIIAMCSAISCNGLDLTLEGDTLTVPGVRSLCGVLICEETINASVSSSSGNDNDGSSVVLDSIISMSVFRLESPISKLDARNKREILVGSVTSQTPTLTQVANGRKVDGLLKAGRVQCELSWSSKKTVKLSSLVKSEQLMSHSIESLEKKMENLEDRIGQLQKESIDNIGQLQKDFNDRTDFFARLDTKLDLFENRVEDKIDNNNNLNKLIQLDSKVSTELAQFRTETKSDIMNTLGALRQSFQQEQGEALRSFSETFDKTLSNTSDLLSSMTSEFDLLKTYSKMNLYTMKNETEAIREMLTSGEVSFQCLRNDTTTSVMEHLPVVCKRDMGDTMPQFTIQRDILCDTQTDGGGWTVIQRRTKGDVYFNRDWESHKNGFGKPDGDFWLGNEAVHILTYVQPYELRIEIQSDSKEYFAHYKTFKVESESDKYRLRLGALTGSLGVGGNVGLSYSNNMFFTTFDRDNDENSSHCALSLKYGWWYKSCTNPQLNAPWKDKQIRDAWYNGKKWMTVTRTEMRPLTSR